MANVHGMVVNLKTKNDNGAGTNEHIYVGVFGKGGGSEFPLDVANFDDFEKGSDVKYRLGDVWDGSALTGAKKTRSSDSSNNPRHRHIDLDKVDYVYLRKAEDKPNESEDDGWKMDSVEVTLYGSNGPAKRVFCKNEDIWLAKENGLQVWLKEK
ncbi:MAG: PLAT/LH2 domain-containing protein [Candidatus Electrothrix aestuarii]|uniref:PLAT/LH2 domain-containing protein n=1 Tax=Candidatus Electrothrix aestuarii TaxID=3062594 RepID=A0AAU8LVP7_9BACT|nr:PLAT/LH2 domain-containing protein [Candidatus Electrothrix aestuarii]